MITLPDRCEFLSDAWLDEAKKFLERECRNRKERLARRTFSVSERFTNAPPHLKFADGVATWSSATTGTASPCHVISITQPTWSSRVITKPR